VSRVADVKATVYVGDVLKMFRRLGKVDTRKVFLELRGPARFDQRKHDREEHSPSRKWPALAASTVARNRYARTSVRKGGKNKGKRYTLSKAWTRPYAKKLLGRMPSALRVNVTIRALTIRSRGKAGLGMSHQAGAIVGHGARVPQRQFLWISPWLGEQARKAFEKALTKAAAGVL
jgi:hypothetical protein